MRRTFLLTAALTVALVATSVTAQNATRCEVDGKVVYGDAACSTGKAVAPLQETAEQRAASKAAKDEIRKDTAYVDKRLDDRYKRDTARPAVAAVSTASSKTQAVRKKNKTVADANGETKRSTKVKKSKKSTKKTAAKAAKKDNKTYRPAPKA